MNIAEILKYCPKETKLYSPLFGEVTLFEVTEDKIKVYSIKSALYRFNYDGTFGTEYTSVECILFPSKDQRDWTKFRLPVKKGDIMMIPNTNHVFIATGEFIDTSSIMFVCGIDADNELIINPSNAGWTKDFYIPASEEAKKKLFDRIKKEGYRWNTDTLELEKIESKFKEGDVVVDNGYPNLISEVLATKVKIIATLCVNNSLSIPTYNKYCNIDNITLASKNARKKLLSALVREGYKYDKELHKLIKQEFKPYDKVLVRDTITESWKADFYLGNITDNPYHYRCARTNYIMCIPFKGNEYLLGTTDSPT